MKHVVYRNLNQEIERLLYLNQELAYQGGHHIEWRHCPDTQRNIAGNDSRRLLNGPYCYLPVPDV
jgi:hypothetical protein